MKKTLLLSFVFLLTTFSPSTAALGKSYEENPTIPTRVISTEPPLRWEDAMVSGNGSTGIMVLGLPLEDLVIINHEKFWTVGNDYRPQTPDLREAWKEAKKMAQEGRYLDADVYVYEEAKRINRELVTSDKPGQWKIDLPANRSIRLHCRFWPR